MIAIIDYGMGNIKSIVKKIQKFSNNIEITNQPEVIQKADKIILPGVGSFEAAVKNIKALNIWDIINETVLIKKKPVLGICLGLQLMCKNSEEGNEAGFGWFDAVVKKFKVENTKKYKVPHTGWNTIKKQKTSVLLNTIKENDFFYFVHSFHVVSNNSQHILTKTDYIYTFDSALEKDNIFGVQFHPEKSHKQGEQIIKNFLTL